MNYKIIKMETKPQYVCLCCEYSTPNRNAMKAHFKTQKHKNNINIDMDLIEKPTIEEIIKKK